VFDFKIIIRGIKGIFLLLKLLSLPRNYFFCNIVYRFIGEILLR
jgi:hypothetical protein